MSRNTPLSSLLASGRIGSLEIRNRILMTPMGSNLAESDGHAGERIQRYYEARSRGGAGLLIVGVAAVTWPEGACNPNQIAISDDVFLPGLRRLTERIHQHGAKAALQIQHASKVAVRDMAAGRPMLVPSLPLPKPSDLTRELTPDEIAAFVGDLTGPGAKIAFHELSVPEIAALTERFVEAVLRARRAGFDAVELHAGHGYLFSAFLSPAANRRTDQYGGPLENRARFLLETLRAVKAEVGSDFPVWCRIDSIEYRIDGGITFADAQRTAELIEAAGADAVHVSAYADPGSGIAFTEAPLVHEAGGYLAFAAGIKRRVGIPVIAVGRIEPAVADRVIREGGADFIAMGRKLLADPELPRKLAEGREEDVRPCIYCYTCVGEIFLNAPLKCAVNPATGREAEFALRPANPRRKILVIGGGPAGMEVARVAAQRGHSVTLCERSDHLGGTLRISSLVAEINERLAAWLEGQVRKLDIDLRLGCEVDRKFVDAFAPDVVVVAVGARHPALRIPGAEQSHVWSGDDLRSLLTGADPTTENKLSLGKRLLIGAGRAAGLASTPKRIRQATRAWMPIGKRVAVLGGGLVGVELAEFFAERGRIVSVLEESPHFATEMALPRRWRVLHDLREHQVSLRRNVRVKRIGKSDLTIVRGDGETETLAADAVVIARGIEANPTWGESLRAAEREVHSIGDCVEVGYIEGAILSANRVARSL